MGEYSFVKILVMILVGALAGTLAARIMKGGDHFGFFGNALLGIAGSVIGVSIYDFLDIMPGAFIVNTIQNTFGVKLPQNFIGMLVAALLGSLLILWVGRKLGIGKKRRSR